MKKKIDKIKSKRLYKNLVYVAVLMSVVLASLMSVLPLKKTVESSMDEEDIQKIFSVDNDTIRDEPKDENKQEQHTREVISFIRQDEQEEKTTGDEGKEEKLISGEKKEESKEERPIGEEKKKESKEEKSIGEEKKEESKEEKSISEDKKEKSKEERTMEGETEREVFLSSNTSCIVPLNGDIMKDFSGDKLVYFKSTDEWRIHKGIDIQASVGTPVKAVLDGYVDKIESDSKSGTTVVIKHSKREKSVYKNLANQDIVMPNQIVKQGDVIGVVDDVAGCGGDSHLHFEIMKDDRAVNPKNYIKFNSK